MATDSSRSLFSKQINDICDQVGVSKPDAFPRWICQNILGIADDEKIDEAVSIGGKNDYGIDIFHAEESGDITEQYICWVQAKFSENLDHVARREDIESFASTLGHLMDCPHSANLTFKQKAVEFAKMVKKYPHMRKKMIFAVAGHLNSQAQELLGNSRWREEKLGNELDSNIDLEILDLDKILSRMTIPHTPTVTIKFDGNVIERIDETTRLYA